jgi:prepilin-type N-terminal cleavage/methylation domain-containing protein
MNAAGRRSFTLIELMIVIVILGILAGAMLAALTYTRALARESATRSTIAKIHRLVMAKYLSYGKKRVSVAIPPGTNLRAAADLRLKAVRDVMRMEMPERQSDYKSGVKFTALRPPLADAYGNAVQQSGAATVTSSELLYLVVCMACGGRDQFNTAEVGDVDKNKLFEFVDGWGRPIMFLRWAPGFLPPPRGNAETDLQTGDPINDHDPLDHKKVDGGAYRLVPLIYSAGSDGDLPNSAGYAINREDNYEWKNDTYGAGKGIGAPSGAGAYDNISNHRLGQR